MFSLPMELIAKIKLYFMRLWNRGDLMNPKNISALAVCAISCQVTSP